MESAKITHNNLSVKLFVTSTLIVTTLIVFIAKTKSISANDYVYEVLAREGNHLIVTEKKSGGQFTTNPSDLLSNSRNERLNINVSKYVHMEIGERGCNVGFYLAIIPGLSASYYISLSNTPASTFSFSLSTPNRGRQTVNLESEEGVTPDSQKACDEMINTTIERDRTFLRILQRHKPIQKSELELTIQNSWNVFNQRD